MARILSSITAAVFCGACLLMPAFAQAPGEAKKPLPQESKKPEPKPEAQTPQSGTPSTPKGSNKPAEPGKQGTGTEKPSTEKPSTEKPSTEKPSTEKPSTEKQGTEKQGKTKEESKEQEEVRTKEADSSEIQLPEGATEDDIRAIRGANAMRETEKKLDAILKKMKVPGDTPFVRFDSLDSWPYEDGYKGMPKELEKLDGKKVAMAGFMLPIDEVEDIKTFYLVKSLWSCCYGIPPDVNGLVKINIAAKKGVAYQWDPILVVGTFRLKKVMDEDYTICIWQMDDAQVRVIEVD